MTIQLQNTIIYKGKFYSTYSNPLADYLEAKEIKVRSECSACWSGYVGTWEIIDSKLYITNITPMFLDETDESKITMESLFPGQDRVFADWYSDEIIIELGKVLYYTNVFKTPIYEEDLIIQIENGIEISSRIENNRNKPMIEDLSSLFSESDD
ncbi:MAG: hypothetical protein VB024_09855 [Dysgonamonadaceae bacterium]|jgi:hypothetical protein|nr:hypothetical protein [Dysgonamonadaceae bacterium]MDD3901631.1 hypothetical protein [Dysgonamonadaceae bacterium]MDD4399558.1 hypothetical protein [Dysgonamonadaceae bacterium]MEA5081910.1 hypothetical protein [Dysgonamonadaceae bacterium]